MSLLTPSKPAMRREDFTVGWVCALAHELSASLAMLDERLDPPEVDPRDGNSYFYGRIGGHFIVLACLPAGMYGLGSAASAAQDMQRSFNLRFCLLVGIGGGIPSEEHDIRLGDVVVSLPSGVHGGVIQYDMGDVLPNGDFRRKGFLNSPPRVLLNAVQSLRAMHESRDSAIEQHRLRMLYENPKMRETYSRPSLDPDTSAHSGNRGDRLDDQGNADKTPHIHYGLIASGNRVIKSTAECARLREDADIICVEMEAAGLMNNLPCLVIRGICDYADSRKNDDWQRFAASTAAAYARELMDVVTPNARSMPAVTREVMDNYFRWLQPVNPAPLFNDAHQKWTPSTGDWFIQNDFKVWTQRNSFLWLHGKAGCGKTILSSTIINEIQKQKLGDLAYFYFSFRNPAICNPRDFFSTILVQLVKARVKTTSSSPSQYILPEAFQTLCSNNLLDGEVQVDIITEVIIEVLKEKSTASIVVDALDECQSLRDRRQILTSLKNIFDKSYGNLRIIITSRREPDIQAAMFDMLSHPDLQMVPFQSEYADEDIKTHLATRLKEYPFVQWSSSMTLLVSENLSRRSNGVFRYAECQLKSLEPCLRESDILEALNHLPKDLDETYARILERISDSQYTNQVYSMLAWLMQSTRPLTLRELTEAAAFSIDRGPQGCYRPISFSPTGRFMNPASLRHLLSELVAVQGEDTALTSPFASVHLHDVTTIAGQSDYLASREQKTEPKDDAIIQLAHFSVKEYLLSDRTASRWKFDLGIARRFLLDCCLIYIRFCADQSPNAGYSDEKYPCLRYMCGSWPFHMRKVYEADFMNEHTEALFCSVFDKESAYKFALQRGFSQLVSHGKLYGSLLERPGKAKRSLHLFEDEVRYCSPAYFLTLLDLTSGMTVLAQSTSTVELRVNEKYREETSLHVAAQHGREEIFKTLLEHGADIREEGIQGRSILHYAASSGNLNIVKAILKHSPDLIKLTDDCAETALHEAVKSGHDEIAVFLAQYDNAKIREFRNVFGLTALQLAMRTIPWQPNTAIKITEGLLQAGADPNTTSFSGRSPTEEAAMCGKNWSFQLSEKATVMKVVSSPERIPWIDERESLSPRMYQKLESDMIDFRETMVPLYVALMHAFWNREIPVPVIVKMAAYEAVHNGMLRAAKGLIDYAATKEIPLSVRYRRSIYYDLKQFIKIQLTEVNAAMISMPDQESLTSFQAKEKAHFARFVVIASRICDYFARHWLRNPPPNAPAESMEDFCWDVWNHTIRPSSEVADSDAGHVNDSERQEYEWIE